GDDYDACRVLLVDKIRDTGLQGRPVALAPIKEVAYVTGEDDPEGLAMVAALAAEPLAKPYSLSGAPLRLGGDTLGGLDAAALRVLASIPNTLDLLKFVEREGTTLRHQISAPIRAVDARVAVPDAPGLGIEIHEAGLRKYRVT